MITVTKDNPSLISLQVGGNDECHAGSVTERTMLSLQDRLRESEETLEAIRRGDVDAIVVSGDDGPQIYTLTNADRPYRELIENMKEGAITLSNDGLIVYCNASFSTLVEEPCERVVGTSFERFVRTEDRCLFESLLRGDKSSATELTLNHPCTGGIPVLLSMSALPNSPDGRIVCAIVTDLRDRRHIKALERGHAELEQLVEDRTASLLRMVEQRRRDEESLRQTEKLQVIGQLTGGIAHDFNNVLQVVSGGVTLMKSPRISDERKAMVLDAMEQAIKNATEMVNRLLTFGRKQALKPSVFQPNEQLQNLSNLLSSTLGSTIDLRTDFAPDLPLVLADPNQFEIAILNLAVNARDAMASGGTLSLRTFSRIDSDSNLACIAVADTGSGMPSTVLARIFEPFFTTKEAGKGTGLGLSQVHGFAKQSGGDVIAESSPGYGTTITLCLPAASKHLVASAGDSNHSGGNPGMDGRGSEGTRAARTILIVDDNHEVADVSAAMLEGLGYKVLKADNAPDALAYLNAGSEVDAVFSDVVMPGALNGVDLAKRVLDRYSRVALVMATGYSDKMESLRQLDVEVLAKPYNLNELSDALERAWAKIATRCHAEAEAAGSAQTL